MSSSPLRHPVALGALALLVLNDHLLKMLWPGAVTGKLSDVAGLLFFPLFLQGLWEHGGRGEPSRRALLACAVASATLFSLVKLTPAGGDLYRWGLALLQWPWRVLLRLELVPLAPVHLVQDPTDLVALPAVVVAALVGWRRVRAPGVAPGAPPCLSDEIRLTI